jgi:hypothetical protein
MALALLLFYLWIFPERSFRLAVGSDTPVYLWWARRTGAMGFRALLAGARPGTVGLLAALSNATHTRVGATIAALQPVLGATVGLATGALVEVALGPNRLRFALTGLFTGTFLSLLVPGYLSTLAFGAMFVAGLACVATALDDAPGLPAHMGDGGVDGDGLSVSRRGVDGWGAVAAAAVLLGGAGLAHPMFLGLGAAILGGAFVALAWGEVRAARTTARSGVRLGLRSRAVRVVPRSPATRLAVPAIVGAAVTVGGLVYIGPAARHAVQTSRDSILRTVGLGALSRASYIRVLSRFFPWYRIAVVVAVAATVVFAVREARRKGLGLGAGPALFWGAMVAWLAVTVGGIVALFAGTSAPGQRMAAFCLALPVFGAVGVVAWRRGIRSRRAGSVTVAVIAVAFFVVAQMFWSHAQPLISSTTSLQFRAAGAALAAEPDGTPIVLISDDRSEHPGFSVPRNLNYLRDSVPTDRVQDVSIFMGSPSELLLGRASATGAPEHDRMARLFAGQVEPKLHRSPTPLAVVLQSVDPEAYASVFHLPAVQRNPIAYRIGPGVMTIPRYRGTAPTFFAAAQAFAYPNDSGTTRFTPWTPVWLAPLLLVLLAAAGWPWARISLPRGEPMVWMALSPALGAAALAVVGMAVDGAGLRLAEGGGLVAWGAVAGGGLAALGALRARAQAARPAAP